MEGRSSAAVAHLARLGVKLQETAPWDYIHKMNEEKIQKRNSRLPRFGGRLFLF